MTEAREHAIVASQLLDNIVEAQEQMRQLLDDPMHNVEAVVAGTIKRHNETVDFTLRVATAHALAALALASTIPVEP